MKRSRNEHVMSTVVQYLKKRQVTESDTWKKTDVKVAHSLQEMALHGSLANESSVPNVIGFSSINRDVTAIDQQFTRLKAFVSEAVEPFKTELTYILFPVFVHLYLELVTNGQKTPALKFRNRHQGLFMDSAEYKAVIDNLANVVSSPDIVKFSNVKAFRENKYTVKLSEEVVDYLLRYLKGNDHLIILQIMNLHIEFKVQHPENIPLHLYEDRKLGGSKDKAAGAAGKLTDDKTKEGAEDQLKLLQGAIRKVRQGPPTLPSICQYTFTNSSQGLSSTAVAADLSLLAGGFEDSAIRLWNLTPLQSGAATSGNSLSRIKLACDYHFHGDVDDAEQESQPDTAKVAELPEMTTLRAHSGSVYGLSFIPGSQLLMSCSEDTTVRAWNTATNSNVALYRGHNYPIWDIDCSLLGVYFATGSQDRTAKLWYLDRTHPMRVFAGHSLDVDCVKFHPNANYLATGSSDKTVRLWNIQDGRLVRMFQGHRGTIFSLAFAPNGQLLASAGEDRRIRIWDLGGGNLLKELRGHVDTVYSLAFSDDSCALASAGLDGSIRIWDMRKGVSTATAVDSHTSPELLASFPSKSVGFQLLHYTYHSMLLAVGAKNTT